VLAVEDSGYGIPAAHLPRITERVYRVSTSRSRDSGGTGLGLSIDTHVLQLHQARVQISSDVGRGSVFACRFGSEPGQTCTAAKQGQVISVSRQARRPIQHPQESIFRPNRLRVGTSPPRRPHTRGVERAS
jgi:hypothetical protein